MPEALRGYLDKLDMTQCSVEEMTKNYREMIRHSERQVTILDGPFAVGAGSHANRQPKAG